MSGLFSRAKLPHPLDPAAALFPAPKSNRKAMGRDAPTRTRPQSGQWRGKSFIQGGRKVVRDALYMPALVAMRFNPDLKAKYQAMIKAGKPPKVALTALMRKLIELANALIKATDFG